MDLQNLIDNANPGDIIELPSGDYPIDTRVNVNKTVTLQGNNTKLFRRPDMAEADLSRQAMFKLFAPDVKFNRIEFEGKEPAKSIGDGGSEVDDDCILTNNQPFMVGDCSFKWFGGAAIYARHSDYNANGLIYNSKFIENVKITNKESRRSTRGYGVVVGGDDVNWMDNPEFGTNNFIFIEDCYFEKNRHTVAGAGGARYVFRNNTTKNHLISSTIDAHGAGLYGNNISTRAYEIYNNNLTNTLYWDGSPIDLDNDPNHNLVYSAMKFRGGEGLAWNNTIEGYRYGILLQVESENESKYRIGYLGGDFYGWNNNFIPPLDIHWVSEYRNVSPNYLVEGTHYHLNTSKPGYIPYPYPHPNRSIESTSPEIDIQVKGRIRLDVSIDGEEYTEYGKYKLVKIE